MRLPPCCSPVCLSSCFPWHVFPLFIELITQPFFILPRWFSLFLFLTNLHFVLHLYSSIAYPSCIFVVIYLICLTLSRPYLIWCLPYTTCEATQSVVGPFLQCSSAGLPRLSIWPRVFSSSLSDLDSFVHPHYALLLIKVFTWFPSKCVVAIYSIVRFILDSFAITLVS